MTAYATIIADPSWQYNDKMGNMKSTGNGAASQYTCLSLPKIESFLIDNNVSVAENAHLWLWTTNAFIEPAHAVARAWGFKPKTVATWVKGRLAVAVKKDGTPFLVQHICQGRYLRNSTEHVIFATRGKATPLVRNIPTAFVHPGRWKGRLHSEKPAIIHEWAERLYAGVPRIELFARRRRPGWDALGDEIIEAA